MKFRGPSIKFLFFVGWTLSAIHSAVAAGLVRDGATARTQGMGGASVSIADSPLEAMTSNPAALTGIEHGSAEFSATVVLLRGHLYREGEEDAHLRNHTSLMGDVAVVLPSGFQPVRFGLSASPSYAAATDWRYRDREGGLGGQTTYGKIDHHSEILAYNFEAGVGIDVSSWFSIGLSGGLVYNQNQLRTAYVFQSEKTLQGFKTLLDLDTEGYGAVGRIGIRLRPLPKVTVAVVYTSPTEIEAEGDIESNSYAQLDAFGPAFAAVQRTLHADAEVEIKLPQKVVAGISWQATSDLLLAAQFDWVNWSSAFDELPVTLSNVSNEDVNGLVGANGFTDVIPLGWRDQKIIRFGAEYRLSESWKARAGYVWSTEVIPSEYLTPLTAAINDSVVTLGVGYEKPAWHVDFSWQWQIPKSRNISNTEIKQSEYVNSEIEVQSHWFGLTYGINF